MRADSGIVSVSHHRGPDGVRVWFFATDATPSAAARVSPLLSDHERANAAAFRFERDRLRYIAAHAALRTVLGLELGRDPRALSFGVSEHGKPFLHDGDGMQFNLSHSGGWAAVALAPRAVGVDVEEIRPLRDADAVAALCFTARENEWRNAAASTVRFFRLWTRKEALVKAIGEGMSMPLLEIEVLEDVINYRGRWRVANVEGPEGCAAAVCVG